MSNALQIILTSCITVVTGVIVFALGHFSVSLFVEPIHKLRALINDIDDCLNYYSDVFTNVGYSQMSRREESTGKFKYQASQLKGMNNFIPWYSIWALLRIVPKRINILEAAQKLSSVATDIGSSQNTDAGLIRDIRHLLGIRSDISE